MCGICGYAGVDRPELLSRMMDAMLHRGPDDAGLWNDPAVPVGLGHRRLSIIDLSPSGRQPMTNEDGSLQLVFNGEIYNYRELRSDLLAKGHVFRSSTDSEVLLHLYEERGLDGLLNALNGMFAFALWDGNRRQLHLARDHAGIKPLYYHQSGEKLFFASEMKALLRVPEIPRRLNRAAVDEYLTLLWVGGRETMLEGVHKLEPGQLLTWPDRTGPRTWFRLPLEPDYAVSNAQWAERTRDALFGAVRRQMVSDVPLGAFLSGGLDSSSIVAAMRELNPDSMIQCFTARSDASDLRSEGFADDFPFAEETARQLGVQLHSFALKPDLTRLLPTIIHQLDEPDADPAAIPSFLIAKSAKEHGTTVLLSGTGGDEVFFGYRSHVALSGMDLLGRRSRRAATRVLPRVSRWAERVLGSQHPALRRLRKLGSGLALEGLDRHMALVSWSSPTTRERLIMPDVLQRCVGRDVARLGAYAKEVDMNRGVAWHSHLLIKTFLAAHNFLYTDKTSMASSVEVRVPYLDLEVLRLAARMPDRAKLRFGKTKRVLREAMKDALPRAVLRRSKTGFGAPLRVWMARDLAPLFGDTLSESRVRERGLFRPSVVSSLWEAHRAGRADHGYLLYALLNLELWQRMFVDRPGEFVAG